MSNRFTGKRAVVTGATKGIGEAIASLLIKDGAEVLITGTKIVNDSIKDKAEYYPVDFTNLNTLKEFSLFLKDFSPAILINNAGINKISPFENIALEDFERIQKVNVTAPFLLCQAVVPGMKKRGWGRIVNISSIWGKISKQFRESYSTSKFALDGMTTALAAEVAQYGVLANCVAPGFIGTELTRSILSEAEIKELVLSVPIKRLGTPEEVASFVGWLASSENTYISGQNIAIDGGFTRV